MSRLPILVSAIATALAIATAADAEELLFTYTELGGINLSFEQSSTPAPISSVPDYNTLVPVSDWSGNVGPYSSIYWYSLFEDGMFTLADNTYYIFGPQVYTGTESAPVFATGVFAADDQINGLSGTLTITAVTGVPEPAGWSLMLVGFGALGAGLRRSRRLSPS